jgi:hypothetical protein
MRRRDLVIGTAGLATAMAAGAQAAGGAAEGASGGPGKDLLELRLYKAEKGAMRERLDKFLAGAAIPAWNRLGLGPVGVFAAADDSTADLYVLLAHKTPESFVTAPARLWADAGYQKAGAAYLDPPKDAPTYSRIETSVMLGFDQCPRLAPPAKKKPARSIQLRIYESYCDERARLKIDMFNGGGEIALFRSLGMDPVFCGQTLAGAKMPNLTYMLCFDDDDARKAGWDKFGKSDGWKKLKDDPKYKDTVSTVTNLLLKPTAYSQI